MKKVCFNIIFVMMLISILGCSFLSNVYAGPTTQVQINDGGGGGGTSTEESTLPDDKAWLTSSKVSCGPIGEIPAKVPEIVSLLILLFEIAVPVILVIFGMIDLSKGIMSQKEDEIKKGQQSFIKRLIAGALVFFIVALVKILVGAVGGSSNNKTGIVSCMNCFLNGDCVTTSSTTEPTT